MNNLELLTDEELENLRQQGRLIGPTSSVTIKQMTALLNAFRKKDMPEEYEETEFRKVDLTQPGEKTVFGIGYVVTENGMEKAIQSYRLKK